MATILVTGANGFIGAHLVGHLRRCGHRVRRALRVPCPPLRDVQDHIVGAIDTSTRWAVPLAGADIVVHLAARVHVLRESAGDPLTAFRAMNVQATLALAEAAQRASVRRFVFLSSAGVYGLSESARALSEHDAVAPHTPYARSKWEAEQALREWMHERGPAVSILRPPIVYGAGDSGNMLRLIRMVARGLPLPFASVRNRRSMISAGNLVSAIEAVALHPAAAGRTYVVRDGTDLSTPELVRLIGTCFEPARGRMFACPPALLRAAGRMIGRPETMASLLGSLCLDDALIRRELGWVPPFKPEQGLVEEIDWYRAGRLDGAA